ncbi:hypothetical protein FS837_005152 [Tulasnella sp. UAMH 9824]|nr:hypothetical protein FS837_005152 [Tulasnella sp. UAMH 9824]
MYNIMFLKLPASEQEPAISKVPTLSKLMELCWQKDPASRLRIDECIDRLERIFEGFKQPNMPKKGQNQLNELAASSAGFQPNGTQISAPKPPPKDGPKESSMPGPPRSQLLRVSVPPSGFPTGSSSPRSTKPNRGFPKKDTGTKIPAATEQSEKPRQGDTSENQPGPSHLSNRANQPGFRKFAKRLLSISRRKLLPTDHGEEISEWDIVALQPDPEASRNESHSPNPADVFLETLREYPREEQIKILNNVLQVRSLTRSTWANLTSASPVNSIDTEVRKQKRNKSRYLKLHQSA